MVLEAIFPVKKIVKTPYDMFLLAAIISFASIFISNMIFPGSSGGKIITLFITASLAPVVYGIFRCEENVERECAEHIGIKRNFIDRHEKALKIFTLMFLGIFTSLFLVSILLPTDFVQATFGDQLSEIQRITSIPTGNVLSPQILDVILWNNIRVMSLSFALSLLIGVGAVVILAWNASILALYLASFVNKGLYEEFMVRTISIIPHAPIEILGYFLAGIAGGMLSAGLIREKLWSKEFLLVFRDSGILMCLAVVAIVIGAFVEVFV